MCVCVWVWVWVHGDSNTHQNSKNTQQQQINNYIYTSTSVHQADSTNLSGGALFARMTSLALPRRNDLSVDRYPKVYLPLFITRAKRVLTLSMAFFYNGERLYTVMVRCYDRGLLSQLETNYVEIMPWNDNIGHAASLLGY